MKLTVLVDNNTLIDRYFLGEPGASYYIETGGKAILFDVGYSDVFLKNARKQSIDLRNIDFVVLSHGHLDHTWGLGALMRLYTEEKLAGREMRKPALAAHPMALAPKMNTRSSAIGALLDAGALSGCFELRLSKEPYKLTERLILLGEIPRATPFEAQHPMGMVVEGDRTEKDYLLDDSALVYKAPRGLVIITGCSHSGICNILEYAKKVCGDDRVLDIIGGLHLLNPRADQLQGTLDYLKDLQPEAVHACHCTDLGSKIALSRVVNLREVGVGLSLEY